MSWSSDESFQKQAVETLVCSKFWLQSLVAVNAADGAVTQAVYLPCAVNRNPEREIMRSVRLVGDALGNRQTTAFICRFRLASQAWGPKDMRALASSEVATRRHRSLKCLDAKLLAQHCEVERVGSGNSEVQQADEPRKLAIQPTTHGCSSMARMAL